MNRFCFAVAVLLVIRPAGSWGEGCRIGVWNIEKLSPTAARGFPELRGEDDFGPRTDEQLRLVAQYMRDVLVVDALVVTEIEADSGDELMPRSTPLDVVVDELGADWQYLLGRSGGKMRIGLVFDTNKIRVKHIVNLHAEEFLVQNEDVTDRDPLAFWVSLIDNDGAEANDLVLIGLHLKSVQSYVRNHMAVMAKEFGDLATGEARAAHGLPPSALERDVLIMGDLNDSAHQRTGFRYLFDYAEGVGYTHLGGDQDSYPETRINGSQIDHIFASRRVLQDYLIPDSFIVHTVPTESRLEYRETYSDHFPLTVDLQILADDD